MGGGMKIRALGYLGLRSTCKAHWAAFATDVLGMAVSGASGDDSLKLKIDERVWRIAIEAGDSDGLAFLGFEVAGPGEFAEAVDCLRSAGVDVTLASEDVTASRGAAAVAQFRDPDGNALELFWGCKEDAEPFQSPFANTFVTGALGMGHALLRVSDAGRMAAFYEGILGFRLTDFITMGGGKSARFLRCNARHHSVGFMDLLPGTGLEHMMVEVQELDDLGRAYDRALASPFEITNTIGRHSNDRMVSFYLKGPGCISIEYGWGGRLIDETWTAHEFTGSGDLWGHQGTMMDEIASARKAED